MSTPKGSSKSLFEDPIIGIDLGTTFCCVAAYHLNKVEIVTNEIGRRTTPSLVSFRDEEILVGDAAKNIMNSNAENTIKDSKRLIGRRFNDPIVQEDLKKWSFTIKENELNGLPQYIINVDNEEKRYYPEEISSMILKKLKSFSQDFLGREVKRAVITVPAYFNNSQREATKKAGEMAGFTSIQILNEPTAAAIAYGYQNKSDKERIVLVFDLGGGTFDVSIVKVYNNIYEVIAVNGDNHLGGEDFNNLLADYIIQEFNNSTGIDIKMNKKAMKRVMKSVEDAKIDLSNLDELTVDIDQICQGEDLYLVISRITYEELCEDIWNKCIKLMDQTINEANLTKDKISDVVLAGGSSRTPKIQEMITEYFGRQPFKSVNPDEAIAYGAILSGISSDYVDKGIIGKKEMKMKKSKIQGIDDLDINKDKGNLLGEASDDDDNDNYHNFKDVSSKNMKEPEKKNNLLVSMNDSSEELNSYKNDRMEKSKESLGLDSESIKKSMGRKDYSIKMSMGEENLGSVGRMNEDNDSLNIPQEEEIMGTNRNMRNEKKMEFDSDEDKEGGLSRGFSKHEEEERSEGMVEKSVGNKQKIELDSKEDNEGGLAELSNDEEEEEEEDIGKIIIKDATPLSIGIGIVGGTMATIIPKLSQLPPKDEIRVFKKTFTVFKDYATSYKVRIFEGENQLVQKNYLLGEFTVTGFKPQKRGEIIIELLFYLDHNSIISVKARQNDKIQKELIIQNREDYSKEEIKTMKLHLKEYEEKERENKERIKIMEQIKDLNNELKKIGENSFSKKDILKKTKEIDFWIENHHYDPLKEYETIYKDLKKFYNEYSNNM